MSYPKPILILTCVVAFGTLDARAVFMFSSLSDIIAPAGWEEWSSSEPNTCVLFPITLSKAPTYHYSFFQIRRAPRRVLQLGRGQHDFESRQLEHATHGHERRVVHDREHFGEHLRKLGRYDLLVVGFCFPPPSAPLPPFAPPPSSAAMALPSHYFRSLVINFTKLSGQHLNILFNWNYRQGRSKLWERRAQWRRRSSREQWRATAILRCWEKKLYAQWVKSESRSSQEEGRCVVPLVEGLPSSPEPKPPSCAIAVFLFLLSFPLLSLFNLSLPDSAHSALLVHISDPGSDRV